jgi:hypothetical protein
LTPLHSSPHTSHALKAVLNAVLIGHGLGPVGSFARPPLSLPVLDAHVLSFAPRPYTLSHTQYSHQSTLHQQGILADRSPCPQAWRAAIGAWRLRRLRGRMPAVSHKSPKSRKIKTTSGRGLDSERNQDEPLAEQEATEATKEVPQVHANTHLIRNLESPQRTAVSEASTVHSTYRCSSSVILRTLGADVRLVTCCQRGYNAQHT